MKKILHEAVILGLGIVIGIVGICVFFMLAALVLFAVNEGGCSADESTLSCFRNWSSVLAIAAGAATVWIINRQIQKAASQHRELFDLQTYPMRAAFGRIDRTHIPELREGTDELMKTRRMWDAGTGQDINIRSVGDTLIGLRQFFAADPFKSIEEYDDGTIAVAITDAKEHLAIAIGRWHANPDEYESEGVYGLFDAPERYPRDKNGNPLVAEVTDDAVIYAETAGEKCKKVLEAFAAIHSEITANGTRLKSGRRAA